MSTAIAPEPKVEPPERIPMLLRKLVTLENPERVEYLDVTREGVCAGCRTEICMFEVNPAYLDKMVDVRREHFTRELCQVSSKGHVYTPRHCGHCARKMLAPRRQNEKPVPPAPVQEDIFDDEHLRRERAS